MVDASAPPDATDPPTNAPQPTRAQPANQRPTSGTSTQTTPRRPPRRPAGDAANDAARGDPEGGRLAGVTAAHNAVRERLGVAPLVWDAGLARYAQAWADKLKQRGCDLQHRPRKGADAQKYGENIYSASGSAPPASEVVGAWVEEVKDYDAKTNKCRGVCGHYTQVVWRASRRLGCGMATCGETEVWVCNYDPAGNFLGQRPY
ncbi:MAG: Fis family transcriptional regulator [Myxococcales bacterium]|nr:Fis family transcriptional regulator [Myxococcales bacterium]